MSLVKFGTNVGFGRTGLFSSTPPISAWASTPGYFTGCRQISLGVHPSAMGAFFEITAVEITAAKEWVNTIARSVEYSRAIHGDKYLKPTDVARFKEFLGRWKAFTDKVGTWSVIDRTLKANKVLLDGLLSEANQIDSHFRQKGMVTIPVPYQLEIVQVARSLPKCVTPKQADDLLDKMVTYGKKILSANTHWYEVIRQMIGANIFAPTVRDESRYGLQAAITSATALLLMLRFGRQPPFPKQMCLDDPNYEDWRKKLFKIYIEASGMYGIQEVEERATAEAVDKATSITIDITTIAVLGAAILVGGYLITNLSPKRS